MAMIPLNDSVTVIKPGGRDEWGVPIPGKRITYDCRIDEGTRLTRNQHGDEVVCNTQILIDGAVAVSYDDEIEWIDATGTKRVRQPIRVSILKDYGSIPLFTEVEL